MMSDNDDVRKIRIVAIAAVVGSFVFALVMLKLAAKNLHLDKGEYFPLLSYRRPQKVDATDVVALKKLVGMPVIVIGVVDRVEKLGEGYVVRIGKVFVLLSRKKAELLNVEQLLNRKVEATGVLRKDPVYGYLLVLKGKVALHGR